MSHLSTELLAFLAAWLPPAPARLLDVGCGGGELTRRLVADGYEAVGLDPDPPEVGPYVRGTLEGFRAAQPFDAAVAIRSLHHVSDLSSALDALAGVLAPGGRLVAFEFAVENLDADAQRWLGSHGLGGRLGVGQHEVLSLATVRAALSRRFRPLLDEPAPYLAWELDRDDLHAAELAAIEQGALRPVGARLVYERPACMAARSR